MHDHCRWATEVAAAGEAVTAAGAPREGGRGHRGKEKRKRRERQNRRTGRDDEITSERQICEPRGARPKALAREDSERAEERP